jgi:hypothetical protein
MRADNFTTSIGDKYRHGVRTGPGRDRQVLHLEYVHRARTHCPHELLGVSIGVMVPRDTTAIL